MNFPNRPDHLTLLHLGKLPYRAQGKIIDVASTYAQRINDLEILLSGGGNFSYDKKNSLVIAYYLGVQCDDLYDMREFLMADLYSRELLEVKRRNTHFVLHQTVGYTVQDRRSPVKKVSKKDFCQALDGQEMTIRNGILVLYRGQERIPILEVSSNSTTLENIGREQGRKKVVAF